MSSSIPSFHSFGVRSVRLKLPRCQSQDQSARVVMYPADSLRHLPSKGEVEKTSVFAALCARSEMSYVVPDQHESSSPESLSHGQESGLDRNTRQAWGSRSRSTQRSPPDAEFHGGGRAGSSWVTRTPTTSSKAKARRTARPSFRRAVGENRNPRKSVIELVPESLARDIIVMPLSQGAVAIRVIMIDPMDFETIDKLRFVLNREIRRSRWRAEGSDR